ncbi:glycoside hydrolase family 18 protein [Phanerochaete sordida]|uniref:Glycoside hydrolase family 18 protein n=1 Tax=Phanerochaete sordida TaxID=48140 RepID=A0A9P3G6H1_9APHY|nr:glycoside hydrolase family 18 protein [Phanerochaete sordida]
MVLVGYQRILAAVVLSALTNVLGVFAVPAGWEKFGHEAGEILARAASPTPHWVVYGDTGTPGTDGPPNSSAIIGFNVFALGFLLVHGASDQAEEWAYLGTNNRTIIKAQYAAAGIKLVVSAFGPSDMPTTAHDNPVDTADTFAAWVKEYDLDGIDVAYEDLVAFNAGDGAAEQWLITFTRQLRAQLPAGQYIITHGPLAPWFSPYYWGGGGYLRVHRCVGDLIDWYNVQFHNQGPGEYETCDGLLTESSVVWPQTALFQIAASGVPLNKLVIGKPASPVDVLSGGYMSPATLAHCVALAKNQGWDGGVVAFEYPDANAAWIKAVRADSWPV